MSTFLGRLRALPPGNRCAKIAGPMLPVAKQLALTVVPALLVTAGGSRSTPGRPGASHTSRTPSMTWHSARTAAPLRSAPLSPTMPARTGATSRTARPEASRATSPCSPTSKGRARSIGSGRRTLGGDPLLPRRRGARLSNRGRRASLQAWPFRARQGCASRGRDVPAGVHRGRRSAPGGRLGAARESFRRAVKVGPLRVT